MQNWFIRKDWFHFYIFYCWFFLLWLFRSDFGWWDSFLFVAIFHRCDVLCRSFLLAQRSSMIWMNWIYSVIGFCVVFDAVLQCHVVNLSDNLITFCFIKKKKYYLVHFTIITSKLLSYILKKKNKAKMELVSTFFEFDVSSWLIEKSHFLIITLGYATATTKTKKEKENHFVEMFLAFCRKRRRATWTDQQQQQQPRRQQRWISMLTTMKTNYATLPKNSKRNT